MTRRKAANPLYDPRRGGQALRLEELRIEGRPFEPPRTNYFTVLFIETGSGVFWADASRFDFGPRMLLCFVPYQHIRIIPESPVRGAAIQFHANFLCVETFHSETGCSGILFNDPQGVPFVEIDPETAEKIRQLTEELGTEQAEQNLAFGEVMLAHLKVLLILATRQKATHAAACRPSGHDPRHPLLMEFRELIETHYQSRHAPSEYADLLHVTPKTLGRVVREHLGTTPTELIRARILTHAKWQLLHTLRPVKEIANEVGFADELYFSRLFKKATGCSPKFFRDFETEIRGGSNLSMFSSGAPIPDPSTVAQTSP